MDEIDPNEKKNRRPVGRERDELIKWATRDREELTRISDEIISNFDRISDSTAAISDYEETLRVLRALRTGTEAKITANIAAYQIVQLYSSTTQPEESNDPPPTTNRGALALREALKLQQEILDDNYKELNRLRVILINVEARIEQMEDEIEATRSILAFIRSRNTTLATQKTAIERDWLKKMDLLSARRQIPEEIWREVFIFRVLDDERQYQLSGYEGTPPFTALKLSGVCQYWRRIALEQPELWAFIAVRNDHRVRTEPRIKYYLWRLDDRPPNVYTYGKVPSQADWGAVSALLSRNTPQCKSLTILVDVPQMMRRFFLPSLQVEMEELSLRKQISSQETIYIFKQRILKVKTLSCHMIQLRLEDTFSVDPRVQPSAEDHLQVETLTFTDCTLEPDLLFQLSGEMPKLNHLDIRTSRLSPYVGPPSVIVQSLRKLSVQSINLSAFSDETILPNLEEVDLTCRGEVIPAWNSFVIVGMRSQSIRVLTLRKSDATQWWSNHSLKEAYESILTSLSNVKCLHLYDEPNESEFPLTAAALANVRSLVVYHSEVDEDTLTSVLLEVYQTTRKRISLIFEACPHIDSPTAGRLAALEPPIPTDARESQEEANDPL